MRVKFKASYSILLHKVRIVSWGEGAVPLVVWTDLGLVIGAEKKDKLWAVPQIHVIDEGSSLSSESEVNFRNACNPRFQS